MKKLPLLVRLTVMVKSLLSCSLHSQFWELTKFIKLEAQAVGALAYGTETVTRVDKIFGPGNAFVNEAKRQVFGVAGIDLLPGPSEVMVIADESANPAFIAAALIAQAELDRVRRKYI